ncbi:MAG: ATP-binding protein [Lachnospiraceae bacterium]|nr:ATP-binding protein [Lachnospiraceae bacterium]
MLFQELILYRDLEHGDILRDISRIYEGGENDLELISRVIGKVVELSAAYGFEGNLWHCFLAHLLVNGENAFSRAAERRGEVPGSLTAAALHDAGIFRKLFSWSFEGFQAEKRTEGFSVWRDFTPSNEDGHTFNKRIRDRICSLASHLAAAKDDGDFLKILTDFYRDFGVGKFGLHKAFRLHHDKDGGFQIEPVTRVRHVYLSDIVGMESQKKKLIDNTEAFLAGRRANNVLLFGDAGTGKSSCIKGILNEYFDRGLRVIELYKHEFRNLNDIIGIVKNRNYRFIIYMDDLSFEDQEVEYKYLKAVIEGGLEKKPDNILLYATSNRRHLVRENFSDKFDRAENDDLHKSDTVQEKLSLAARFGVTIYFGRPDKKEFDHIVKELAARAGISIPEKELLLEANRWELSHGGMSGRTAEQFIDYMLGTVLVDR